jgi:asparagine synthase (glutamine-hydrolysing)
MKLRGLESKHILKRAVRGIVPDEILNRSKQGFGLPMGAWINNQLRERMRDTLVDLRTRQRGYVKPEYVSTLLDEHERGRRDHSTALWSLLMLELWHRSFVDRKTEREGYSKQLCA